MHKYYKVCYLTLEKTWNLLLEIGIRALLPEAVGGGLFRIGWKVITPDVEGVANTHSELRQLEMHEVCFVFSQAAGFSWVQFLPSLSGFFFAKEIVHKPKQNSHYAEVFPNISIALEQIHIFKVKCSSRSDCIGTFRCQCFHSYGFDFQDRDWWVRSICAPVGF